MLSPSGTFQSGQRVEVWLAGWDQWVSGSVEQTGYIGGMACALVRLDRLREPCVFRLDQIRAEEGLFGILSERN